MPIDLPPAVLPGGELHDLIVSQAQEHGLDPLLVAAIVCEESRGVPDAVHEHSTGDPAKASYGLMQVVASTAWWHGFEGAPGELLEVEVGLYWGCVVLRWYLDREAHHGKHAEGNAIESYHTGRHGNTRGTYYWIRIKQWREALREVWK